MAQTAIQRNDPKAVKKWAGDRELSFDVRRAVQENRRKKKSRRKKKL
jgi:hypothetical protein